MAYALGFDQVITDIIYSMRDWNLETVKQQGGTPSALCFRTYDHIYKEPRDANILYVLNDGPIIHIGVGGKKFNPGRIIRGSGRPLVDVCTRDNQIIKYFDLEACCGELARPFDFNTCDACSPWPSGP